MTAGQNVVRGPPETARTEVTQTVLTKREKGMRRENYVPAHRSLAD